MRFQIAITILIYLHLGALSFTVAQDEAKVDGDEMLSTIVPVVDPDGHPLEGAVVELMWMNLWAESGTSYPWPPRLGAAPKRVTNEQGIAELPFPKFVREKIAIDRLYLKVSHPDYVLRYEYHKVENGEPIRLEHGFRIAATAIHGVTGEKVLTNLYGGSSAWKLAENGTLVSPVYSRQPTGVRLVTIEAGEPRLFSDLIIIEPGDRSRVFLKDVKLWPGVTINGTLEESIPRPIKNGIVEARLSLEIFDSDEVGRIDSIWTAYTTIQEDGRFTFASFPRGGIVQLLPICDHWSSRQLPIDEVKLFFPEATAFGHGLPQLFRWDSGIATPVLQMVPAATLKARVVDGNDTPVSGAEVHVSPNKRWFESNGRTLGGGLLTTFRSNVEFILDPEEWESKQTKSFTESMYTATYTAITDHNGIAVIEHIPPTSWQFVGARKEGLEMPIIANMPGRVMSFQAEAGSTHELTIRLQPAGTEVRGENVLKGNENDD